MALKTNNDCEVKSVKDDKKSYDIDTLLEYGKYQAIRVWGFGILLGRIEFLDAIASLDLGNGSQ